MKIKGWVNGEIIEVDAPLETDGNESAPQTIEERVSALEETLGELASAMTALIDTMAENKG